MERYDDLKGLFDAMNDFRFSTVIDSYSQLSTSSKYAELVETAKKNIRNGWNPKTGNHNPQYNKVGENIIIYKNYINWIDRDREKPEKINKEKSMREKPKLQNQGKDSKTESKMSKAKEYDGRKMTILGPD